MGYLLRLLENSGIFSVCQGNCNLKFLLMPLFFKKPVHQVSLLEKKFPGGLNGSFFYSFWVL
ncbi:hypothetical protein Lspi_1369 [Legionella spiritensis]|uniref:Uncharacterized protein n=1 Tax=Legionella spiritensis TaxID=452 RepID=A0A0W0Z610_LEGSP|nr:hypothetical protein Lspi_1369 [Legionella spiritensis]SNV29742.1 Uncharacterised protein [Legionella spiritensis]